MKYKATTPMVIKSAAMLIVPLKRQPPIQESSNYDHNDYSDCNNSNIRQSKHANNILCGMLSYNIYEIAPNPAMKNFKNYLRCA